MNKKMKKRLGFTLVELLTVIAIIGILATILIPTIGNVLDSAKMTKCMSNLGQICKDHQRIAMASARPKLINSADDTPLGWAIDMAEKGGIDDPALWFCGADETLLNTKVTTGSIKTDAAKFKTAGKVSFDMCDYIPSTVSGSNTKCVVAWTRGHTGKGWKAGPVWQGDKGHIGYADGHVETYDDGDDTAGIATENLLTNYATKAQESDPGKASPAGAASPDPDTKVLTN